MANISWIKLSVNLFDDEKIKIIRAMPEGDKILLIWIQLLCMAGKVNDKGSVYIGQNMYYTDEMLATICQQPLNIIRLAIQTFINFDMVVVDDEGLIQIENWEKHQNIEGMEKIRAQTRKRVAKHREQKALEDSNVTVTLRNATDKTREDKNRLDIDKTIYSRVVKAWNDLEGNISKLQALNSGTDRYRLLNARIKEHGEEAIIEAIERVGKSRFLKGFGDKGWVITFDWFIKPNNFIKVWEGNYDDKEVKISKNTGSDDYSREELKAIAEKKKRQGLGM